MASPVKSSGPSPGPATGRTATSTPPTTPSAPSDRDSLPAVSYRKTGWSSAYSQPRREDIERRQDIIWDETLMSLTKLKGKDKERLLPHYKRDAAGINSINYTLLNNYPSAKADMCHIEAGQLVEDMKRLDGMLTDRSKERQARDKIMLHQDYRLHRLSMPMPTVPPMQTQRAARDASSVNSINKQQECTVCGRKFRLTDEICKHHCGTMVDIAKHTIELKKDDGSTELHIEHSHKWSCCGATVNCRKPAGVRDSGHARSYPSCWAMGVASTVYTYDLEREHEISGCARSEHKTNGLKDYYLCTRCHQVYCEKAFGDKGSGPSCSFHSGALQRTHTNNENGFPLYKWDCCNVVVAVDPTVASSERLYMFYHNVSPCQRVSNHTHAPQAKPTKCTRCSEYFNQKKNSDASCRFHAGKLLLSDKPNTPATWTCCGATQVVSPDCFSLGDEDLSHAYITQSNPCAASSHTTEPEVKAKVTCARCHQQYAVRENHPRACRHHPGTTSSAGMWVCCSTPVNDNSDHVRSGCQVAAHTIRVTKQKKQQCFQCGREYSEEQNTDGACQFHPSQPIKLVDKERREYRWACCDALEFLPPGTLTDECYGDNNWCHRGRHLAWADGVALRKKQAEEAEAKRKRDLELAAADHDKVKKSHQAQLQRHQAVMQARIVRGVQQAAADATKLNTPTPADNPARRRKEEQKKRDQEEKDRKAAELAARVAAKQELIRSRGLKAENGFASDSDSESDAAPYIDRAELRRSSSDHDPHHPNHQHHHGDPHSHYQHDSSHHHHHHEPHHTASSSSSATTKQPATATAGGATTASTATTTTSEVDKITQPLKKITDPLAGSARRLTDKPKDPLVSASGRKLTEPVNTSGHTVNSAADSPGGSSVSKPTKPIKPKRALGERVGHVASLAEPVKDDSPRVTKTKTVEKFDKKFDKLSQPKAPKTYDAKETHRETSFEPSPTRPKPPKTNTPKDKKPKEKTPKDKISNSSTSTTHSTTTIKKPKMGDEAPYSSSTSTTTTIHDPLYATRTKEQSRLHEPKRPKTARQPKEHFSSTSTTTTTSHDNNNNNNINTHSNSGPNDLYETRVREHSKLYEPKHPKEKIVREKKDKQTKVTDASPKNRTDKLTRPGTVTKPSDKPSDHYELNGKDKKTKTDELNGKDKKTKTGLVVTEPAPQAPTSTVKTIKPPRFSATGVPIDQQQAQIQEERQRQREMENALRRQREDERQRLLQEEQERRMRQNEQTKKELADRRAEAAAKKAAKEAKRAAEAAAMKEREKARLEKLLAIQRQKIPPTYGTQTSGGWQAFEPEEDNPWATKKKHQTYIDPNDETLSLAARQPRDEYGRAQGVFGTGPRPTVFLSVGWNCVYPAGWPMWKVYSTPPPWRSPGGTARHSTASYDNTASSTTRASPVRPRPATAGPTTSSSSDRHHSHHHHQHQNGAPPPSSSAVADSPNPALRPGSAPAAAAAQKNTKPDAHLDNRRQ
eukprot:gnl/Spiro4/18370_TR9830_c0_g1_i1.p1 gnl/Spiro4/18370_TR9830_c0_g1~~gnl/Spiro4/18370_TR9830_c0_g1_i1.p1  ORF type:complete len:1481 (+),score=429.45 gnl/Spiro4/18370_TR9830_c0_g1_i1:124-4566(+)